MAKLSVITPTFNGARYLGETLDSVAALRTPHEHIVVDGGSSDDSVAVLRVLDAARESAARNSVIELEDSQ